MTKSELVECLTTLHPNLQPKTIDECVKELLEQVSQSMEKGQRVEVRGFGSFSLHYRQPRLGRNPKTGDSVNLNAKYVPHFKAGKDLKDCINFA